MVPSQTPYREDQEVALLDLLSVPDVVCNTCGITEVCTEYKENYECAYRGAMEGLTQRDSSNLLPFLEYVADLQRKRMMRGVIIETAQGGMLDANLSRQIDAATKAAMLVKELKEPKVDAPSQTLTLHAETRGEQQGPGLLQMLMSKVSSAAPRAPEVGEVIIDAEPQE
jgi:hypothetical protein